MAHLTDAELDWTIQRARERVPTTCDRRNPETGRIGACIPPEDWWIDTSILAALEELKDRRRRERQS